MQNILNDLRARLRSDPDRAIATALFGVLVLVSLMYVPGHAALQAWRNLNNPILYADRYAYPELFPNDRIISHLREIYPFLSIVYWLPAVLLKYAAVPPAAVTLATVALNDSLIAVAVYWLARAFEMRRQTSVIAALFAITSKVLSWDLGGYEYYGHDFAYSGSFYLPFAVAVIPSVITGRIRLAIVLSTITALIFAPAGALMCGVIVCVLVARRHDGAWRSTVAWFGLPLLAFAWSAGVQAAVTSSIHERFTRAEDLEVVMVNGHLVPYWIHGQVFASTYLGFFVWCGLGVLSWRQWRKLSAAQRLPILILTAFTVAGALVGILAVIIGAPFLLRLGPFRYFLLIGIILVPLVIAELVERISAGDAATRAIALMLLVLLAIDRGTAWMLPLILPCASFLALRPWLGPVIRWLGPIAAIGIAAASLDILLNAGIAATLAAMVEPTGRIAALLTESSRRLAGADLELLLLPVCFVAVWLVTRTRRMTSPGRLVYAVAVFLFACTLARTATNAAWAATGPPTKLAEAELWAKRSTPLAAKFIFLELEPGGSYPSWQTLSQRAAAELQYTHQKVYLPDRQLLEIDKAVSANYGFDPASVDGKLYPFYALDLQQKYLQFTTEDFLRVGRLSGSNFAVVKKPRALGFPIAFQNDLYAIHRLPAQFGDLTLTADSIGPRSITVSWSAAAAPRPDYQLSVDFRHPANPQENFSSCCVTIDGSAGTHTFTLPERFAGRYLAMVGLVDVATGSRRPLPGDASGENRAFWEYLVD